jgi:hypothetical protein
MRVDRDTLIDLARKESEHRAKTGDVISTYLIGSVARGDYMLGDTTDIDIVMIHDHPPTVDREIKPISGMVHFDIAHHHRDLYQPPRELRIHPWLGPPVTEPVFLFDPDHFFEWAQAGARGQFFRADHKLVRAQTFLDMARTTQTILPESSRWLKTYLQAVIEGANGISTLHRFPAAGRRILLDLESACQILDFEDVYTAVVSLLGAQALEPGQLGEYMSAWEQAYSVAADEMPDVSISPVRWNYFHAGVQALLDSGQALAAMWPMLTTWERAMHILHTVDRIAPHRPAWDAFLSTLDLSEAGQQQRQEQLDHFLDRMDYLVEHWADRVGA